MDICRLDSSKKAVYGLFDGNPDSWITDEQELKNIVKSDPSYTYVIYSDDTSISCLKGFCDLVKMENVICDDRLLNKIPLDVLYDIVKGRESIENPFIGKFNKLVEGLLEANGICNNCKLLASESTLKFHNSIQLYLNEYRCAKEEGWHGAHTGTKVYVKKHAGDANITLHPKEGKAVLHKTFERSKWWERTLNPAIISIE